jgi:hypothetical protein
LAKAAGITNSNDQKNDKIHMLTSYRWHSACELGVKEVDAKEDVPYDGFGPSSGWSSYYQNEQIHKLTKRRQRSPGKQEQ